MKPILRVALPVPLDLLFDYRAPDEAAVSPGCRVLVPFGRRETVGIVVELSDASELPDDRLKAASRVLDATPLLAVEVTGTLAGWVSAWVVSESTAYTTVSVAAKPVPARSSKSPGSPRTGLSLAI